MIITCNSQLRWELEPFLHDLSQAAKYIFSHLRKAASLKSVQSFQVLRLFPLESCSYRYRLCLAVVCCWRRDSLMMPMEKKISKDGFHRRPLGLNIVGLAERRLARMFFTRSRFVSFLTSFTLFSFCCLATLFHPS